MSSRKPTAKIQESKTTKIITKKEAYFTIKDVIEALKSHFNLPKDLDNFRMSTPYRFDEDEKLWSPENCENTSYMIFAWGERVEERDE
jgi:hypothetical protein